MIQRFFTRLFGTGRTSEKSVLIAAAMGPPIAMSIYTGLGLAQALGEHAPRWKLENIVASYLFFGIPMAWAGTVLIGFPLWGLLKYLKLERGIIFGAAGFVAPVPLTRNGSEFLFWEYFGAYAAGILGFLVAMTCWLIASNPRWRRE